MAECLHPIHINKPARFAGLKSIDGFQYISHPDSEKDYWIKVPRYSRLYGFFVIV